MIISLVVAAAENNVIGKDNQLQWHLPADMKFFKQVTTGRHVVMGRKTFDALGKPLPNRTNIIISRQNDFTVENSFVVNDLKAALDLAKANGETECMVIGGGEIYNQALVWADKIYLTRVHANVEGDTFFPEINSDEWNLKQSETHEADEKHLYSFTFQTWERKM